MKKIRRKKRTDPVGPLRFMGSKALLRAQLQQAERKKMSEKKDE